MFFFNKKTPEEKEAARIAKLRKAEGDRGFGGALMTPVGELALADICLTRLHPETQTLVVHCQKREFSIPYANLRGLICSSEAEIARGESPITAEEMNALIEGDAGQFVGPLDAKATHRARWFLRLDYVDETRRAPGAHFHRLQYARVLHSQQQALCCRSVRGVHAGHRVPLRQQPGGLTHTAPHTPIRTLNFALRFLPQGFLKKILHFQAQKTIAH